MKHRWFEMKHRWFETKHRWFETKHRCFEMKHSIGRTFTETRLAWRCAPSCSNVAALPLLICGVAERHAGDAVVAGGGRPAQEALRTVKWSSLQRKWRHFHTAYASG
jgi:hypothetical protein